MLFTKCSFDTLFQLFSTISVKASAWNLCIVVIDPKQDQVFVFIGKLLEWKISLWPNS